MLAERFNPSRQNALVCRDGCAFLVRRPILNSDTRHSHDRADLDECLEAIPHHPDVRILHCADPTVGQRQTAS